MKVDFNQWLSKNLSLGKNWKITDVEFDIDPMNIHAFVEYCGSIECPICHSASTKYDVRKRTWREIDYGKSKCNVTATFPRVDCPYHGVHEIDIPWSGRTSKLTLHFESESLEYIRRMPLHLASKLLDVNDKTLWNIVHVYSDDCMRHLDLSHLRSICIDEFAYEKGHNYITSAIDTECGAVFFATLGKDSSVLTELKVWLIHHNCDPKNIELFCCDMSPAYMLGIRTEFPWAQIVFDKFHIIKAANDTVDRERKLCGIKCKEGKGLRFGFLMNREELDKEKTYRERVKSILDQYHTLGKAYMLKESLREFFEITDEGFARLYLMEIIDICLRSDSENIFDLGLLLDEHFEGIINWQKYKISNGIAEGTNSVNQAIKVSARGYRDPENFVSMIYLRNRPKFDSV